MKDRLVTVMGQGNDKIIYFNTLMDVYRFSCYIQALESFVLKVLGH